MHREPNQNMPQLLPLSKKINGLTKCENGKEENKLVLLRLKQLELGQHTQIHFLLVSPIPDAKFLEFSQRVLQELCQSSSEIPQRSLLGTMLVRMQ